MKKYLSIWFPIAVCATVLLLVVYGVLQAIYRQAANDPQIELVENAKDALNKGLKVESFFANTPKVDMASSLSMFAMIFDDGGNPLASTAYYGSSTPLLPPNGVFGYVREHGQDRVTWQTATGLRFAAVIDRFESRELSGFVLAARSMREVDERINDLAWMIFCGWLIMMVATGLGSYISFVLDRPNEK